MRPERKYHGTLCRSVQLSELARTPSAVVSKAFRVNRYVAELFGEK